MWVVHTLTLLAAVLQGTTAHTCTTPTCSTSAKLALLPANHNTTDYIYIGGVFGIHEAGDSPYKCGAVRDRGIQNMEAFFWAARTFKDRYPDRLQGVDIGVIAFDSCSSSDRALQQIMNLENCVVGYGDPAVNPSRVLGFVGPDSSAEAMAIAPVLDAMQKTIISHAATSASLNQGDGFSHFLRTVPSDAEQALAMASIIDKQGWKYVQTVHSSNTYGTTGIKAFQQAAEQRAICIVNSQVITETTTEAMKDIIDSLLEHRETTAVVVFANDNFVTSLLQAAQRQGIRRVFTWVGTSSWGTNTRVVQGLETYAEGAVTMALDSSQDETRDFMDDFESLSPESSYNPWIAEYWQERFQCYLPGSANTKGYSQECVVNAQTLKDTTTDSYVPYAIKATDALLAGISDARKNSCPMGPGLCSDFLNPTDQTKWASILHKIISLRIQGVRFDENTGDSVGMRHNVYNYRMPDLFTCTEHCYQKVGTFQSNRPDVDLLDSIYSYFENGTRNEHATSECGSQCAVCGGTSPAPVVSTTTPSGGVDVGETTGGPGPGDDPPVEIRDETWVIVLIILASMGILMVIIFELYLMSKMLDTPFVTRFRTMWLGQLLLLAIFLSYLTLFAFVPSPTDATCGIIRFGVGSCYAMCFAVLLVKLMIIHSSETIGYLKGIYQILMFIFAWGVQIAIDVEWLILREPQAVYDDEREAWTCRQDFETHITTLAYVMFLILVCTVISVKTHGIATNHREGIFVGMSAGFTIPVWLAWILLGKYNSNSDHEDPCVAFGLFATATLILFIMFLPKVRQLNNIGLEGIYAEDDGPTPEYPHSIMAPSVMRPAESMMGPGSVLTNNVAYLSQNNIGYAPSNAGITAQKVDMDVGSLVQVDGEVYEVATIPRNSQPHYETDPSALYMRHPGAPQTDTMPATGSLRSVPVGYVQHRPPSGGQSHTGTVSSRVLRVTNDLTGRMPVEELRVGSEYTGYGTTRSARSVGSNPSVYSLRKAHSFHDIGAL